MRAASIEARRMLKMNFEGWLKAILPASSPWRKHTALVSVVEHYIEKGTVDFQPAVVINKTQLPELIHKKVHA